MKNLFSDSISTDNREERETAKKAQQENYVSPLPSRCLTLVVREPSLVHNRDMTLSCVDFEERCQLDRAAPIDRPSADTWSSARPSGTESTPLCPHSPRTSSSPRPSVSRASSPRKGTTAAVAAGVDTRTARTEGRVGRRPRWAPTLPWPRGWVVTGQLRRTSRTTIKNTRTAPETGAKS